MAHRGTPSGDLETGGEREPARLSDGIDAVPRPVVVRAGTIPVGRTIARHFHRRAQLLYASRGVLTAETDAGVWVVPPQRAVWLPAFIEHEVRAVQTLMLRNVYVDTEAVADLPGACCVVTVTPLLRELILHASDLPALYDPQGPDGRIMHTILDQLRTVPVAPLHLPMSQHPRLTPILAELIANPADSRNLEDWSAVAGASARTLARLFVAETGMTFGQWRQQARLLEALKRLAHNEPVTTIALDLGYGSQSAFIHMFKKALGRTPGRYFRP